MEENVKLDYDLKKFYREREAEDIKNSSASPLQTVFVSKNTIFDPHLNNILWESEIIQCSSEISFQAVISNYNNEEPKLYIHKHINTVASIGGYKKIIVHRLALNEFFTILKMMKNLESLFENYFYSYLKEEREKTETYLEKEFSISSKQSIVEDIEKSNNILRKIK